MLSDVLDQTSTEGALKDTHRVVGMQPHVITDAVEEVRKQGLLVISLNMAGSVPDAADLVVSDPVQAGVMAVMAVAHTAKFNLAKLSRKVF